MAPHSLPYAANAARLFEPLLSLTRPVLLHSADAAGGYGRYDIMSADPVTAVHYQQGALHCGDTRIETRSPLSLLAEQQQSFAHDYNATTGETERPPFVAGFIGYFAYGLHQQLERHAPAADDPLDIPTLAGGFYDFSLVTDHQQKTTTLYTTSQARQRQVLALLANSSPPIGRSSGPLAIGSFKPSTSSAEYIRQFDAIQRYLTSGDTYQVNLAVHYQAQFQGHPWHLYRQWCEQQPAPFSAYVDLSNSTTSQSTRGQPSAIISLSPERFLRVNNDVATVSPIKGTRPRGRSAKEDAELASRLSASEKDQAENLMIVDLLRNDLGQVCRTGSINVTELFRSVAFHNVHHLVSTITGQLLPDVSALEAFATLFPSGSITGAPKLRSIDIINELEPVGRSIYCGSIGYWDVSGNFDSNVAIRTAAVHNKQLHLWGGGAVVADSNAAAEQQEILAKIGRLLESGA